MSSSNKKGLSDGGKGTKTRSSTRRLLFDEAPDSKKQPTSTSSIVDAVDLTIDDDNAKVVISASTVVDETTAAIIPSTPIVPSSSDDHTDRKKRKRGSIENFATVGTKKIPIVTPSTVVSEETDADHYNESSREKKQKLDTYIPTYIHKNVEYVRNANVPIKIRKIYSYIRQHYIIPDDIEHNRTKYGPLSGSTYEDLIVSAYTLNKLQPRNNNGSDHDTKKVTIAKICTECATIGHERDECPTLA